MLERFSAGSLPPDPRRLAMPGDVRYPAPARFAIAVASGKGGVGKSTVALNLALALGARPGTSVGVLDADVYAPDIPVMVNLTRRERARDWVLWRRGGRRLSPVDQYGLKVMSAGFLLGEDQVFPGRELTLEWVIRQLVVDVDWGDLDYLVVDLPPGTADLQQQLFATLPLAGALVVVTPQDVAHLDARKIVELLKDAHVPVLGGVENMSGFVCPHCGERTQLFPDVQEERSLWSLGVPLLARVPFDPAIGVAGERGRPVVAAAPQSPQAAAFHALAARVAELEA